MPRCTRCGNVAPDGAKYCENCGAPLEEDKVKINSETFNGGYGYSQPEVESGSHKINAGMLVWSILNLLICCQILGIVSLIMTVLASSAETRTSEMNNLRTAKILNIIGTICGALIIVFYIIFVVVVMVAGMESSDASTTLSVFR